MSLNNDTSEPVGHFADTKESIDELSRQARSNIFTYLEHELGASCQPTLVDHDTTEGGVASAFGNEMGIALKGNDGKGRGPISYYFSSTKSELPDESSRTYDLRVKCRRFFPSPPTEMKAKITLSTAPDGKSCKVTAIEVQKDLGTSEA